MRNLQLEVLVLKCGNLSPIIMFLELMSTIFLASILMFITENMDNAEKYKKSSMGFFLHT